MFKHSTFKQYVLINALVFVFFVFFAAVSHTTLTNKQELELQNYIEQQLSQFMVSGSERVQRQVEKLRAISSFVSLTEQLTPSNFEAYSRQFAKDDHGWLVIEWQPIVASSERAGFEAYVSNNFFPDFRLWELDENEQPISAKIRNEHVPVLFMVAKGQATDTTGLDLAWSEKRMLSKWSARDSGNAQLSGLFNVVLSPEVEQPPLGFAITLPVYDLGFVPETRALRQQKISGYLAGVYSIENALQRELDDLSQRGLSIKIADGENNESMFGKDAIYIDDVSDDFKQVTSSLSLYGQNWDLTMYLSRDYIRKGAISDAELYPAVIMLFWLLAVIFLWSIHQKNTQLIQVRDTLEETLERVKISEKHFAHLSLHDPLTGLLNRRAFIEQMEQEMARANRYDEDLSLLIVDMDEFKKVNDTYGHLTGDVVLKQFAEICRRCCRAQDIVCRFGGEEFAILMINTDAAEGMDIAGRLLEQMRAQETNVSESDTSISVTFSGGLTSYRNSETITSFLARADNALYNSKHKGRNQITRA